MMKLVGERVLLSGVEHGDLAFVSALECNEQVWIYEDEVESDREAAWEKYQEQMDSEQHHDFVIMGTIEGRTTPIGLAQIWSYVEERRSWEVGFGLLPQYQGRGYGGESVKLLLDLAFTQLDAHKVVGMCNSHNRASVRLMERLGFRREGVFKEELFWRNEWRDQFFFALLQSEHAGKT